MRRRRPIASLATSPFPLFLSLLSIRRVAATPLNTTIDDTNTTAIVYLGTTWAEYTSSLDYGGSHAFCSDAEAGSAKFAFVGTAIYYLSPRWPYPVSVSIALDGGPSSFVNLTDPSASSTPSGGSESAMSSVAWFSSGLTNASHSVVVGPGSEGFIVVDGFIFTSDNGAASSSSASPSASSTASSSTTSSSSTLSSSSSPTGTALNSSASPSTIPARSANHAITVGLATGLALSILIAILLVLVAFFRRRRRAKRYSLKPKPYIDDEDDTAALTSNRSLASSRSTWDSVQRGTRRLFAGIGMVGGARGNYAPVGVGTGVGTHVHEMSAGTINAFPYSPPPQAGAGLPPLVPNRSRRLQNATAGTSATAASNPFVDPWSPNEVGAGAAYDPPLSHSQGTSYGSSYLSDAGGYGYSGLPRGAMSPPSMGIRLVPTSDESWAPSVTQERADTVVTSPSVYTPTSAGLSPDPNRPREAALARAPTISTAASGLSRVEFAGGETGGSGASEEGGGAVRIRPELTGTDSWSRVSGPPPYEG